MSEPPLDAIERILEETEDADDVLRGTVAALVADPEVVWAGIGFLEDGALTLGPSAGTPDETRRAHTSIAYRGALVGELWVDGSADRELLEHVGALIAPHVLIGWDTGGKAWEP